MNLNDISVISVMDVTMISFQFHFNATKRQNSDRKQDVLVRVQFPTSVISNLHDFGVHVVKEDRYPSKIGSLILFWGPEDIQRLNATSVLSVTRDEDQLQVGSQPLRITHLQPEYTLDYTLNLVDGQEMQFKYKMLFLQFIQFEVPSIITCLPHN